jgi:phospho-N-acetylmuramoyl-pentapeptide-transferase
MIGSVPILPLALGLVLFSFFITSVFVVPFIDFLYKINLTRRKEGNGRNKALFDKLHDKKAGTPIGGGVLIIVIVSILFLLILPLVSRLGVRIDSSFKLIPELIIIFFTFISFGLLGLVDDFIKTFGKPQDGVMGSVFGLKKGHKFLLQWILAIIIAFLLYGTLGIHYVHIPLFNLTLPLGIFYIPFASTIIVFFANAFNFTDGLDGLACPPP